MECVRKWKPCRPLDHTVVHGVGDPIQLGAHHIYLGKDYFASLRRAVVYFAVNLLTCEKVWLPDPLEAYEIGIDDSGLVYVYDTHADSDHEYYPGCLFHAVMCSGGGTDNTLVMNMDYADDKGTPSSQHMWSDVHRHFKYAKVSLPLGLTKFAMTFNIAAFDWNSGGAHLFWDMAQVHQNANFSVEKSASQWVSKRMFAWINMCEHEFGAEGLCRKSRQWSSLADDNDLEDRVLEFASLGTPAFVQVLIKSAFGAPKRGGGMEDHHDKARARNVLQSVLSTLMDWDWKLCLF